VPFGSHIAPNGTQSWVKRSGDPRELVGDAPVTFAPAEGQYREGAHRRSYAPAGQVGRRDDVSNGRWQASGSAGLLGSTATAVNSMLRRPRRQAGQAASVGGNSPEQADPRQRTLLDQYAAAFENADGIALARLLRADAVLEMPPSPTWFAGRDQVAAFLATRVLGRPGDFTMVRVAANGQSGFAAYRRDRDGRYCAHAVHVLTVDATSISRVVSFNQPELFAIFSLPPILPGPGTSAAETGQSPDP